MTAIAKHEVGGQPLGGMLLEAITPALMGASRDNRKSDEDAVAGSTMNLLSYVFTGAQKK
ncbi:MAG TPA: hypothetical protein VF774_09040 [Pseudoduganella sp.]|jgi:hypothetical protein